MESTRAAMLVGAHGDRALYGINTGFGSFASVRLSGADLATLQANIVRSHSAGVGDPLPDDVVRATMVILAASLARAKSGVRACVVESIVQHLNDGVTPVVPSRGSVGASGDLAPLAHIALALIGEGTVRLGGRVMPAAEAHRARRIGALQLAEKEGLALLNGTHLMAALGALVMHDAHRVVQAAIAASAMALDACRATHSALDERIHHARAQPGQQTIARAVRRLLDGSTIPASHKDNDPRVQDPYSLRAIPQVLGAALDALEFARGAVERELGAVTDNPLVFVEGRSADIVSGANFHGMPLAIALDLVKIALSHVAGISERRTYWALSGHDRESRLPAHMSPRPGLESGLMIAQYTAAACCNELRTLAYPSSVGNIPTCAGIEDYNSMGATSALHAAAAVRLCRDVISCELLVMAQGIDHHRPLQSGIGVERVHAALRAVVPPLTGDRPLAPDIARIAEALASGTIGAAASIAR